MLLRGTYTFAIDSDRRNGYPVAPSSLPHFGTAIMDDPTSDILGARDFGLVQQLLNEILNAENCKCARAQQAVDLLLGKLSEGSCTDPLPHLALDPAGEFLARQISDGGSFSDLETQVMAAAERVSALRRRAADVLLPTPIANLEALRPCQKCGELKLLTPCRADKSPFTANLVRLSEAAATQNDDLLKVVDKLPGLRAGIDVAMNRLSMVMRALEDQMEDSKIQSMPLPSLAHSSCSADPDWVVGVIARADGQ